MRSTVEKTTTTEKDVILSQEIFDENNNSLGFEDMVEYESYIEETKEIDFDENGCLQYEDDLDENGNQQMIYKYDTRFLEADGTLIADEATYNIKLASLEDVYIAQFIGCTYHCG